MGGVNLFGPSGVGALVRGRRGCAVWGMSRVAMFGQGCRGPAAMREDPVLSLKIVFCLHLFARTIPCGRLNWTNFEVSFNWSATFGAKLGGIRELKTAIQTSCCHRFLLSFLCSRLG